ncbi:hypothetical protein NMG60_11006201 [Bertholletia excelsa]
MHAQCSYGHQHAGSSNWFASAEKPVTEGYQFRKKLFRLFYYGELLVDIFTMLHETLKKPVNRGAVAIASECLRILVILQTLSKASECQKGYINLLLEAIIMIFTASDNLSQELHDLRSTAGKFVSQLAQISSSAVYLKEVLLEMPEETRQQLQGIIVLLLHKDIMQQKQNLLCHLW